MKGAIGVLDQMVDDQVADRQLEIIQILEDALGEFHAQGLGNGDDDESGAPAIAKEFQHYRLCVCHTSYFYLS